jgi:hypothetical protein
LLRLARLIHITALARLEQPKDYVKIYLLASADDSRLRDARYSPCRESTEMGHAEFAKD